MCNDAFEDAQGHYPRDPTIHGSQTAVEDVPPLVSFPGEPSEEEGEILNLATSTFLPFPKILSRKRKPSLQWPRPRPRNARERGRRRVRLQIPSILSGTTNAFQRQSISFG
jgi:hypothetical protein